MYRIKGVLLMAQPVGYECDNCKKLTKDIFTVSVDSDKHLFKYETQVDQPRIILTLCRDCLFKAGEVISNAICG